MCVWIIGSVIDLFADRKVRGNSVSNYFQAKFLNYFVLNNFFKIDC